MNPAGARVYLLGAVVSVGVAVIGSLHPFDVHWVPLTVAAARFWDAGLMDPRLWSETDALSNFLLFVPIGCCAAAALTRSGTPRSGAIVVAGGILLSALIELGQVFVSWRTPSIIDVLTEGLGTFAGVSVWRIAPMTIDRRVLSAIAPNRHATAGERLLLIYVGAFAWFWLMPFDFTIRPAEVIDKYAHLRLLLPFSPSPDAASRTELHLMTVAAVPIGMAAAMRDRRRRGRPGMARSILAGAGWIVALTAAQVFVFSRTTDTTLVVAGFPGAALGVAAAHLGFRAVPGAADGSARS